MVQNEKVRQEFSQRLAQACVNAGLDDHGRGMVIARALKVSSKGVSKWLNAESLPRQERMNALAKLLKVDVVWLQHGKVRESSEGDSEELNAQESPELLRLYLSASVEKRAVVDFFLSDDSSPEWVDSDARAWALALEAKARRWVNGKRRPGTKEASA